MRHLPPIERRMKCICRGRLYRFLTQQNLISRISKDMVKLNVLSKSILRRLVPGIIEQLKHEISLCKSFEIDQLACGHQALEDSIARHFKVAKKQLAGGFPETEWDLWANLEEVDANWLNEDFQDLESGEPARTDLCSGIRDKSCSTLDDLTQARLKLLLSNRPEQTMVANAQRESPKGSNAIITAEKKSSLLTSLVLTEDLQGRLRLRGGRGRGVRPTEHHIANRDQLAIGHRLHFPKRPKIPLPFWRIQLNRMNPW